MFVQLTRFLESQQTGSRQMLAKAIFWEYQRKPGCSKKENDVADQREARLRDGDHGTWNAQYSSHCFHCIAKVTIHLCP